MKNLIKATVSTAVLLSLPILSFAEGKSIYGVDNRLEYFEASAGHKTLSDSVVSLWKSYNVTANASGKYDLDTTNFGTSYNLCPGEKFKEQPLGAFCSGSLVGDDLIMTAGHCIKTLEDCKNIKLVFGYKVGAEGSAATTSVGANDVYTCASIVKRFLGGEPGSSNPAGQTLGADYALIKLDRKVVGRKPLAINRGSIAKNTKIFVIGHPVGLPLKVAGNASVRDASKQGYFVADLDTFGGNSGSPVFNETTKKIEGILVRGDNDFIKSPAGCTTMATFEQTGGRGEDVTKLDELLSSIPALSSQKDEEAVTETLKMDSTELQQSVIPAATRTISFD